MADGRRKIRVGVCRETHETRLESMECNHAPQGLEEEMKSQRVGLETIANGAAPVLFREQLDKVLANIHDPGTRPEVKRSIVLTVVLEPDKENRDEIAVSVAAVAKLAPKARHTHCRMMTMADGGFALAEQMTLFGSQDEVQYDRETGEVLEHAAG